MKRKLFFCLFLVNFIFQGINAQVWEPVGDPSGISVGSVGRNSLIFDTNDDLIVGYYDVSISKGSVQKFDGTQWDYLGDESGMTTGYATYNSLSVDSEGTPYFFNQAGYPDTGHEVRKFVNGAWEDLPNVTDGQINYNSSTFSFSDVLFASNNENNGTVKKYTNGSWSQVGNTGFSSGVPFYLDMAAGSNGKVYVSFNNNGFLHVYENDETASTEDNWQPVGGNADLAPAASSENYNSSMTIDSDNNLYVAYVSGGAGGNKLNAKKFDGTSWIQLGPENFTDYRVQHISIAVGANGIVYIALSIWEDATFLRNLVMAYDEDSNSWYQAGTGYASENQATFNSLSVDSMGNLALAFMDSGLGKLSVKKLNLFIPAAEEVEITTEGEVAPEITVDNGSLQLTATVTPEEASQDVVWSIIEGDTFATIDQNGLLTAIASNAVVTVKAHSAENSSIFDTIEINITNQQSDVEAENLAVTTLNNVYPDINELGGTLQLVATVLPAEADQYVTWTIEEGNEIVSVDENGLVTGLAEGFAIIRATHEDGELFDEIRVNVWANGCSQGEESMIFGLGYNITNGGAYGADDFVVEPGVQFELGTVRLSVISPANVDLTSFDLKIFKNKNGDMPGEEVITISNIVPSSQKFVVDWEYGLYQYEVELNLPETLTLSQGTYWLQPLATAADGGSVYWDVTVYGTIGGDYQIDYLDGNGWRKLAEGGFDAVFDVSGNCTTMPVLITTVDGGDATVLVGETLALQAEVDGTENQEVTWSITEGEDLISVDENGWVTGLEVGVATVRATSVENGEYDEMEVTVVSPIACMQEVLGNAHEEGYLTSGVQLAIDIDVPEGTEFEIYKVKPITVNYSTEFQFKFYQNNGGFPGAELQTVDGTIIDDVNVGVWDGTNYWGHEYTVELTTPVELTEGKYWMEIITNSVALESSTNNNFGLPSAMNNGGGWSYSPTGSDFVYKLLGECDEMLGVGNSEFSEFNYYPNPVKDELFLQSAKNIEKVEIFNLAGQKIKSESLNFTSGKINTNSLVTGVYMFRAILSDGSVETFKVIKK